MSVSIETTPLIHRCPACATQHEVTRARAEMARGAQLCCSPACDRKARLRAGELLVKRSQIMTEAAAYIALAALIPLLPAVKWA